MREKSSTSRPHSRRAAPSGRGPHAACGCSAGGAFHDAPVYRREALRPGDAITGPAIIAEANATTVLEPQWQARVTSLNHLVLTRNSPRPQSEAIGTKADPVMLEIFNNLFMAIAEQMGVALANTAYSVNIKERLDFSCALFDTEGDLIANAPHLPVHLGAMGESVRAVASGNAGMMRSGDVYVLNNPYQGGTHLPDVTVVTPVFDGRRPNRHREMPARSRRHVRARPPGPHSPSRASCSMSPAAAITPTSAGSPRARCRPTALISTRKAC